MNIDFGSRIRAVCDHLETVPGPPLNTYYKANLEVPEGRYAHETIQNTKNNSGKNTVNAWLNANVNTAVPAGTVYDGGRDEISIAEALPDYHSAFIGKWHLGGAGAEGYQPADQGFHPIAWFDAGGSQYFNWRQQWNMKSKRRGYFKNYVIFRHIVLYLTKSGFIARSDWVYPKM